LEGALWWVRGSGLMFDEKFVGWECWFCGCGTGWGVGGVCGLVFGMYVVIGWWGGVGMGGVVGC